MENNNVQVFVLAAGRSTRIQDPTTKMLHKIGEMKILERVLENIKQAGYKQINLILGHQKDLIIQAFPEYPYIIQKEQLGTGDAVKSAFDRNEGEDTLILFGDKPLLRPETIREFVESHKLSKKILTASTVIHPIPENYSEGYGTVVRVNGEIKALRKTEDTMECDGGMYIFKTWWLWKYIESLQVHDINGKVEYYIPDMIELAINQGREINEYRIKDYREATGINTPAQKEEAQGYLRELGYAEV